MKPTKQLKLIEINIFRTQRKSTIKYNIPIISLNNANSSELSYIVFTEYNIKFPIDSGSTKSILDPQTVYKLFPKL